jgi:hypothetical protein
LYGEYLFPDLVRLTTGAVHEVNEMREFLEERKRVLERKKAPLEQTLAVLETLEDEHEALF